MRVEDTDNLDPRLRLPIHHQMRPTGMDPHRRRKLCALAGDLRKLDDEIKKRKEAVRIAVRLIHAPSGGPLKPDLRKIDFGGRP